MLAMSSERQVSVVAAAGLTVAASSSAFIAIRHERHASGSGEIVVRRLLSTASHSPKAAHPLVGRSDRASTADATVQFAAPSSPKRKPGLRCSQTSKRSSTRVTCFRRAKEVSAAEWLEAPRESKAGRS
jgi:hypothetical protein